MKDLNEDLIREAMDDLRSRLYTAVRENKQLKAQVIALSNNCIRHGEDIVRLEAELEKARCCGSCRWWSYFVEEEEIETCCAISGAYGMGAGYCCDQWEVRE